VNENKKVRKEKDKEIRKEKKEITPSRDKVVPDYNRDDILEGDEQVRVSRLVVLRQD